MEVKRQKKDKCVLQIRVPKLITSRGSIAYGLLFFFFFFCWGGGGGGGTKGNKIYSSTCVNAIAHYVPYRLQCVVGAW